MPPRSAKKAVIGPGQKRSSARAAKRAQQSQPESEDSPAEKAEEVPEAPVKEEVVEKKLDAASASAVKGLEEHDGADPKKEAGCEVSVKKEDLKESVHEYEKDERLELEDNEPEYEPEEDGGVDYDDKEIEEEEFLDGDEVVEEFEEVEDIVEEEDEEDEGDMVEDIEDVPEELEDEGEDEEHAAEKNTANDHAEMVDEEKEHHEVFKERRKRKEFEVFVGGLDKDATENDLKKVFGEVGEVTEVRLMKNPQTKKNKGFAFLRFATVEQAKRAVIELKNPVVNGKQCGVTASQDSDTLFLGNICKTWTKDALREKLKHCGVENVDDLTLVEDSNNMGTNRGFAFLEFSSRSDAMDAFKRLQKRDITFGVDRAAKVSFADSFIDPGDEIMSQVKTVFVDGLPSSWDEDRVKGILKKYGDIEKIELARNMPSAKRKDFGFVTFNSHDAAVTCAKSINNVELGEGDTKAKVRARLSRPLQRGKGKHGGRVDFRAGRVPGRSSRGPWGRPLPPPRSLPVRIPRGIGGRVPAAIDRGVRRPIGFRDRRPPIAMPVRPRPLPLPSRSYEKRVPASLYPKNSLKRDFSRREELPPRNRAAAEYSSRVLSERRSSYRDVYAPRGSGYTELPRSASRIAPRRSYVDDGYGQRFDRPPPSYRDGRARDYDSMSGSKRPYSSMDDVPHRYTDAGGRQSRARLDYDIGASGSQYGDTYSDRLGRSNIGYSNGRSSISSQDPHGIYGNRHEVSYARGSYSGGGGGGMYSSSFSSDYGSRGTDAGGTSYSSLYSSRGLGGSSYMGSGSGSYY